MNKKPLFTLFIIVFLDLLGLGIVFPILAPLLLDTTHHLLPEAFDQTSRSLILGLLFAIYPLTQFFGAPILGSLSDHYGRKKILLISLAGTLLGYLIFAYGIMTHNIYLLFLSRAIDGFTGGNISIAQSAIADISDHEHKARNFGIIGMSYGLGFILGPFFGGILSDPKLVSWFNFETPFWFAAIISLASIGLVFFTFKDTLKTRKESKISFLAGIMNLKKAYTIPNLRIMFLVNFLLIFGFSFFTQFFPVYLIQKFALDQGQIGNIFAYIGLWSAIAQGFFMRPLSKKHQPGILLAVSTGILGISLLLILVPSNIFWLLAVIPFVAVARGINQPNSTAIISNMTKSNEQGEILGINQSVTAMAHSIPPIIAGIIVTFHQSLPIVAASISVLAALFVFIFIFDRKTFHANK